MATRKRAKVPHSPLTKSISAYTKRFRTKVPAHALKNASQSRTGPTDLQTRVDKALQEGRPDPEWEQHLKQVRSLPDSELSVDERADKAPLDERMLQETGSSNSPPGD